MSSDIDAQSTELLRGLVGQVIRQIAGTRYPGVTGYSEIRLLEESGRVISLTLRAVDVTDELEVCVPVARVGVPFQSHLLVDRYDVTGLRIAKVCRLQRRESIEWSAEDENDYVGSQPREQHLAEADHGDAPETDLVDAGIAFENGEGLSVECYADSFPLVFQLRIAVAGSSVPVPRRVPIA